jgi:hypothetical protein
MEKWRIYKVNVPKSGKFPSVKFLGIVEAKCWSDAIQLGFSYTRNYDGLTAVVIK